MGVQLESNNPKLTSWVKGAGHSDFPIQNLPFGVFSTKNDKDHRLGVAIGSYVLDLKILAREGYFESTGINEKVFLSPRLNELFATGRKGVRKVRDVLSGILRSESEKAHSERVGEALISLEEVTMHMPISVPNYTDFYSSMEHARNVGSLFRDPENALMPNWKHLPVGYHGRASSIQVSGVDFKRPWGQVLNGGFPVYQPTKKLDFELEVAFITSAGPELGTAIPVNRAEDFIIGLVLFNDWSARDIQQWEYKPLGPFLGKSFISVVSPWVVTLDALEPFRCFGPKQDSVLPYLQINDMASFDIDLEVLVNDTRVSEGNFNNLYWSMSQQLAHQTSNGCNIDTGDMYASGTISGKLPGTYGSLLEITRDGKQEINLNNGSHRIYIENEDTVTLKGYCLNDDYKVGFGECFSRVLPPIKEATSS